MGIFLGYGADISFAPRGDAVLGVMMGLALVEGLGGARMPYAIEVIGFSDEEGTRFGAPFVGSRAVVNELGDALLESKDADSRW